MTSISVVIPAYNHASTIGRAIESVINQTHKPDEIIVVDDGSDDDTQIRLERYEDQIRYFFQENQGVSVARNAGIKISSSKWVSFLDADDEWLPYKLEQQLQQINLVGEEVACIYSRYIIQASSFSILSDNPPRNGDLILEDLLKKNQIGMLTVIARRDVMIALGGFDDQLRSRQDWDMWLRMAIYKWRFSYISNPLAIYSLSESGLHSDMRLISKDAKEMFHKIFSLPGLDDRIKKLRPMTEARYSLQMARRCASFGEKVLSCEYFRNAVITCPRILLKMSTYGVILRLIIGKGIYDLFRRLNRSVK